MGSGLSSPEGALRGRKITVYTDDPGEGGVAIYCTALLCAMASAGLDVSCIQSPRESAAVRAREAVGVKHHWLGFQTRADFRRTVVGEGDAEQAFHAMRPDILLFANCSPFSHIAAKAVAMRMGIPFIIVEGYASPIPAVDQRIAWFVEQSTQGYANAAAVIAVSHETLDLLRRFYGLKADKGEVIHYGCRAEFFTPRDPAVRRSLRNEWNASPQDIVCLTAARLERVKGWESLMTAIARLKLRPAWNQLHFVWAGAGSLEPMLRKSIADLEIADRVHLLGWRTDIANLLDASDVFILPSRQEGMPLSIMEAMAKGLGVIASSIAGIPEELGTAGRLITAPHGGPEPTAGQIASTLEQWTADPTLLQDLGKAAHERAQQMFREDRMIGQTVGAIERALQRRGKP
jgi:glycosyltransferase involved in cell wall biosynthesis